MKKIVYPIPTACATRDVNDDHFSYSFLKTDIVPFQEIEVGLDIVADPLETLTFFAPSDEAFDMEFGQGSPEKNIAHINQWIETERAFDYVIDLIS